MWTNYFTVAWRNGLKNKGYSLINIIGLAAGTAIALLIGLWIWDEVPFDRYHQHYDRLAQVMDVRTIKGEITTDDGIAIPLSDALRSRYGADFKHVAVVFPNWTHTIAARDKKIAQSGEWVEPDLPDMLALKMISGNRDALKDPSSVLITQSLARALFADADPVGKPVRLDNMIELRVGGVFEDLPRNTSFYGTKLFLPWARAFTEMAWLKEAQTAWDIRSMNIFVELNEGADLDRVNARVKAAVQEHVKDGKEEIFLHPMSKWHLYSEFKNGKVSGGRIRLVWLFGCIGGFVLLLACINFMNLSTARSAGRAKEVGIRKAIGSRRSQLIGQFLCESVLVALLAGIVAIGLVWVSLPFFNRLTEKQIPVPFGQPLFWLLMIGFTVLIGLVSGSYPAFYLSAFRPVKVLKTGLRAGRLSSVPRKVLIVLQFTVSILLTIGTIVVYRQIAHAKDRPVGYTREGLITITMNTPEIYDAPYNELRSELLQTGFVADMAKSSVHITENPYNYMDMTWKGKDPNAAPSIGVENVTHDFGNTIGWHLKEGRDFSRLFVSDSGAAVLNESAVRATGLRHPVGETINFEGQRHLIIGVANDMVMESPYLPVPPVIFRLDYDKDHLQAMTIRIKAGVPLRAALPGIEAVFKKVNPGGAFEYQFTDEQYAEKFADEQRIASLAIVFTVLAIFISCLGLFGLASFTAEQRTKEIGVRKVLGASVATIWRLLVKDFIGLVVIALLIASPVIYFFMQRWLQHYPYRTRISGWIFLLTGIGVLCITLLTVSYQSIKAALMNPVKSLKME